MLSPHDRLALFEALRPPPGFGLDHAIATSFTLDLEALLTAPVAFALFDSAAAREEGDRIEPVGLLDAIRRHADRITLFCQAGQIAVPTKHRDVFAWLEDMVFETVPPRGLFHPKLWIARFAEIDGPARVLRVLCATRNVTFDQTWDTLLRLDSDVYDKPGHAVASQAGLGSLINWLPSAATHALTADRHRALGELADDVWRVPLHPPEPFRDARWHVLGLPGPPSPSPLPSSSDRAAIVSAFLGEPFVTWLTDHHDVELLVSRPSQLDAMSPGVLGAVHRVAVLNDHLDAWAVDDRDADDPDLGRRERRSGLHAKLFMFDVGNQAHVFTGSANASDGGFHRNVEVVAELIGPHDAGVTALTAPVARGESGFDQLLVDYEPPATPDGPDPGEELSWALEWLRTAFAAHSFTTTVVDAADGYVLQLRSDAPFLGAGNERDASLMVWPLSLTAEGSASAADPTLPFAVEFQVSLEGITAFFCVEATLRNNSAEVTHRFLVTSELIGAPPDRHSRLLAAMLRDPDRLIRYFLLLLADPDALTPGSGAGPDLARQFGALASWDDLPLLELFVRALDRFPDRLDHIHHLLADMGGDTSALPAGFDELWEAVWTCREGLST